MNWDSFESMALDLVREVKKLNFDWSEVGLLGIARGGLPLLTFVAEMPEIQDVYTVKASVTNSDRVNDYMNHAEIWHCDLGDKKKFVVFDDIVETCNTIVELSDYLTKKNVTIEHVFCLFGIGDPNTVSQLVPAPLTVHTWKPSGSWINFCWEKGYQHSFSRI